MARTVSADRVGRRDLVHAAARSGARPAIPGGRRSLGERDLFPDRAFILSARLDEARCRDVITTYEELKPYDRAALEHALGEEARWASWFRAEHVWWNPVDPNDAPTWVWHSDNGGAWTLAQCANGRLYYDEHTH